MASVWNYAEKRKNSYNNEIVAICGSCKKIIKCSGGSTTSLKAHLKMQQKIELSTAENDETQAPVAKKMKTMMDFVIKKT